MRASGDLLLTRAVRAPIAIEGVEMFNDSGRVAFKKREGSEVETETTRGSSRRPPIRNASGSPAPSGLRVSTKTGRVLAEIPSQTFYRDVVVSRDFGKVVRIEREGNTTRLFGYTVTAPCKP